MTDKDTPANILMEESSAEKPDEEFTSKTEGLEDKTPSKTANEEIQESVQASVPPVYSGIGSNTEQSKKENVSF